VVGTGLSAVESASSADVVPANNALRIHDFRDRDVPGRRKNQEVVEINGTKIEGENPLQVMTPTEQTTVDGNNEEEAHNATQKQSIELPTAGFDASKFSFSACEKLDMALQFMTSLDFRAHFQQLFSYTNPYETEVEVIEAEIYTDVYFLQLIFTPIFLALLLFGANFFLHTFVLCAAVIGLFVVFDGLDNLLPIQIDCPMKLSLSIIASFLCSVLAATCFRVGVFAIGSVTFGGSAYVVFDTFPHLDPGAVLFTSDPHLLPTSDLSTTAWVITAILSVTGGVLVRYFEMAQLEIMTAGMGGIGFTYSLHAFCMVHDMPLDPAVVFLLAFFISFGGWKFQRYRRLKGVLKQQYTIPADTAVSWQQIQQQQELKESLTSLLGSQQEQQQKSEGPSVEQISKLTLSLNRFMDAIEEGGLQEQIAEKLQKEE